MKSEIIIAILLFISYLQATTITYQGTRSTTFTGFSSTNDIIFEVLAPGKNYTYYVIYSYNSQTVTVYKNAFATPLALDTNTNWVYTYGSFCTYANFQKPYLNVNATSEDLYFFSSCGGNNLLIFDMINSKAVVSNINPSTLIYAYLSMYNVATNTELYLGYQAGLDNFGNSVYNIMLNDGVSLTPIFNESRLTLSYFKLIQTPLYYYITYVVGNTDLQILQYSILSQTVVNRTLLSTGGSNQYDSLFINGDIFIFFYDTAIQKYGTLSGFSNAVTYNKDIQTLSGPQSRFIAFAADSSSYALLIQPGFAKIYDVAASNSVQNLYTDSQTATYQVYSLSYYDKSTLSMKGFLFNTQNNNYIFALFSFIGCTETNNCFGCNRTGPITRNCTTCGNGFQLTNGDCLDINECNVNSFCAVRTVCQNYYGTYSCYCNNGGNANICPGPVSLKPPPFLLYEATNLGDNRDIAYAGNNTLIITTNTGLYRIYFSGPTNSLTYDISTLGFFNYRAVDAYNGVFAAINNNNNIEYWTYNVSNGNFEVQQVISTGATVIYDISFVSDLNSDGIRDITVMQANSGNGGNNVNVDAYISGNGTFTKDRSLTVNNVASINNGNTPSGSIMAYLGVDPKSFSPTFGYYTNQINPINVQSFNYGVGSYFNSTAITLNRNTMLAGVTETILGSDMCVYPDIGNDGYTDLALGSTRRIYLASRNGNSSFSDLAFFTDTTYTFNLQTGNDFFGRAFAHIGDYNFDGFPDFALVAQPRQGGGSGNPTVWIVFTSPQTKCIEYNPCAAPRTCYDSYAGPLCSSCPTGYYEIDRFSCQSIDYCKNASQLCDTNATCANVPGGYKCTCIDPLIGNGTRCGPANCSSSCDQCTFNVFGFYQCVCKSGYTQNGFLCVDIDECLNGTANCDPNAICANTIGGYTCTCPSGFTDNKGNGWICDDINECVKGTAKCATTGAACINTIGSYQCQCLEGYTGDGVTCTAINNNNNKGDCNGGISGIPGNCRSYAENTWVVNQPAIVLDSQLDMTNVNALQVQGNLTISSTVVMNYRQDQPAILAFCADLSKAGSATVNVKEQLPDGTKIVVIQTLDDCLVGNFTSVNINDQSAPVNCQSVSYTTQRDPKSVYVVVHRSNTCSGPSSGLTGGQIAGIVIGSVVGGILVIVGIGFLVRKLMQGGNASK